MMTRVLILRAAMSDSEAAMFKTLHMLMEPARASVRLQGTARELLGRAVFVGAETKGGAVQ